MKGLTFNDCRTIKELHNEGLGEGMIAVRFGVDPVHIQNIIESDADF